VKLVSACLLGIRCNWKGDESYLDHKVVQLAREGLLLPVCPEQLGGLPTPRSPQEIQGGDGEAVLDGKARVVSREGVDVTAQFIRGAEETLKIARLLGITEFIGKSGSPSCSCDWIYDGSFSGGRVPGKGITAALLERNGIRLLAVDDLEKSDRPG
jgi:uncharacterized protein YbbK (DUF523 family)